MKRSIINILIISVILFTISSCNKDEDVSKKHIYTPAELAYKDSVEAAKQNVKANYIATFTVTIPLDTVDYSGPIVQVDTVVLLHKLGMSNMKELNDAMGTVDGGVQSGNTIKFFAINNSTRYDYTNAFTADGFGHWFDANGDVCNWGDKDRLYSFVDPATFSFTIGQHPKHLKTGDKYKIIQAIKKGEYRVAFVFNVIVGSYIKH